MNKNEKNPAGVALKYSLLFCVLLIVLVIAVGSSLNDKGLKYSKAVPMHCSEELFILSLPDSNLCCDVDYHYLDWVCVASFDRINTIFSSYFAFFIPLIPLLFTTITEVVIQRKFDNHIFSASIFRTLLCIALFFFRLGVLYLLADVIQSFVQGVNGFAGGKPESCWYVDIVRTHRCKDHFDFSDHVVLNVVNYIIPISFEFAYVFTKYTTQRITLSAVMWRYWAPLTACVVVMVLCLRTILFSCLYFHTPRESWVGFLLATCTVVLPLYSAVAGSNYWAAAVFGSKSK